MNVFQANIQFFSEKTIRCILGALLNAVLFVCCHFPALAEEKENNIIVAEQSQENGEEATEPSKGGKWVPIPIFLTEPAIGYGLGLSIGYIHPEKSGEKGDNVSSLQTPRSIAASKKGKKKPPSITGVAGGYTESDTWFGAIGHSAS